MSGGADNQHWDTVQTRPGVDRYIGVRLYKTSSGSQNWMVRVDVMLEQWKNGIVDRPGRIQLHCENEKEAACVHDYIYKYLEITHGYPKLRSGFNSPAIAAITELSQIPEKYLDVIAPQITTIDRSKEARKEYYAKTHGSPDPSHGSPDPSHSFIGWSAPEPSDMAASMSEEDVKWLRDTFPDDSPSYGGGGKRQRITNDLKLPKDLWPGFTGHEPGDVKGELAALEKELHKEQKPGSSSSKKKSL